jgi:hypothetical protein
VRTNSTNHCGRNESNGGGVPTIVALIDLRVNDAAMQLRPVTYRECVTLTLIYGARKDRSLESTTGEPEHRPDAVCDRS